MRGLRITAGIVAGLLVLVAACGLALWLGGGPVLAWALEHPVSAAIGRQISVDGPLRVRWGYSSHIVAENIRVANASWGSKKDMFSARRLEFDVFLSGLLRGKIDTQDIRLEHAQLLLETSREGQHNWDVALSGAAPQHRHQFPKLRHLAAEESELTFRNGETGAVTDLGIDNLDIAAPQPQSPIKIALTGSLQKQPIRLAGTIGALADLRDASKPYPVKLDGTLGRSRVTIDGTLGEPLDVAGVDARLSLDHARLAEIGTMLGVPIPELPVLRGTARLSGGEGKWGLSALTVAFGHSDLEGGIAIDTTGKVPALRANLTARTVDLRDFNGVYGGKPTTDAQPGPAPRNGLIIPDTPLDTSKLPGVNADLTFDATRIESTGGAPLERISLGLQLKDGELNIAPLRFETARGDVDFKLHYTPFTRTTPPRLHATVDIRHVDLHKLLGGPGQPEMLRETAGIVGGYAKIVGTGVSLRQLLSDMNGEAGIFMENGRISQLLEQGVPLDLLGALGVYVSGDKPVPINCLMGRFEIKNGIAAISTLLLDTAATIVTGDGSINFPSETFLVTLKPYNKHFTLVAVRAPVDVHGTFAKPTYDFRRGPLMKRLGQALGLGVLFPPAALVPLVDTGLGENNACHKVLPAKTNPNHPAEGSSAPR
ncbi:MAG TPA: AsmA family protein [Stellaceae bacterium]|nr:AsmA family protein [Stellaceae bacterium]